MPTADEIVEFEWPETGKLEIELRGTDLASLRFSPANRADDEGLQEKRTAPYIQENGVGHQTTQEQNNSTV